MNSPRSILFIAFLVVSFFLFQTWMVDTAPGTQAPSNTTSTSTTSNSDSTVPEPQGSVPGDSSVPDGDSPVAKTNTGELVEVKTDVLDIVIDAKGGDIVSAKLLEFAQSLDSEQRFQLLQREPGNLYIAQSGLIGPDGIDSSGGRAEFSVEKTEYVMENGTLEVPLTYQKADGTVVKKIFSFKQGQYDVGVRYEISNNANEAQQLQFYGQLQQTMTAGEGGSMIMPTYFGAAYSHDDDKFEKYDFEDMQDQRLNVSTQTGWVSMLEHYFVSAWIPTQQQDNRLFSRVADNSQAIIGVIYPMEQINAGETAVIESTVYLGPKDQDSMAALVENLDLTVDYGFLWWLAQPIFKLLQFLQSLVLNWGLAIILTTVVVKAALFPLTKAQYVSMAKMRMLQPKMTAMRERYGSDRQKMSQAMMKLYKEEKVNPLGGCLPMLLQLPIFLALYWVLLESVELRHSEFVFWIQDLSTKDPYYILPILMGASMFLMQKLQPTPTADPMQQKLFQYMPVIFTVFFLWFPSGLVLYWLVSNLITIAQMLIIYKGLEKKGINVRGK
ncbi:MAG: membrane protein insertase YidC [Idiomarina sp.]|uniref:membrane protein insertase YidC n=1 Tax=Idiomarina sp. TaxID=1874361 RepID=UPI000C0DCC4B|nr:membrane protein insertase YidC [Idiomarina sp.]MAK72336.1 membrane protein insertase YidC [Idiomarinaceae bacterium]MBL4742180.1 membrane protein insertase YidC [Idiomarina sp.]MBT43425.1 membrane protein insertase YidC [Idiomarina sp.]PHQ77186.1 MAG: membrane protein insertase YidC [Idiomarina sp.]HAD49305.1 membrane protein insertase YidC [Idiomarina sp.]